MTTSGARNWTHVAKSLPGRIGKQCRERWHNHLDPNISKRKWTMEEDLLIVKLHLVHGNRWCDIAKQVDGRTDNAIKNRYNSNLRKRLNELEFMKLLKEEKKVSKKATTERGHEDSVTLEAVDEGEVAEVENLSAFCENLSKKQQSQATQQPDQDKTFEMTSEAIVTSAVPSQPTT